MLIYKLIVRGADKFVRASDRLHARRIAWRAHGLRISRAQALPIGRTVPANVGTRAYDEAVAALPDGVREANRAARNSAPRIIRAKVARKTSNAGAAMLAALQAFA